MTPQQLKNSILKRAMEGRLVPQRAEEGTAQKDTGGKGAAVGG